jgi:hypothetical protein
MLGAMIWWMTSWFGGGSERGTLEDIVMENFGGWCCWLVADVAA